MPGRLVMVLSLAILGLACSFSAHPPSGVQACSGDQPPRCADGYTCVAGLCYQNNQVPDTGGSSAPGVGGSAGTPGAGGGTGSGGRPLDAGRGGDACTPVTIDCGKGAGKRCGKIPDACSGSVDCGACVGGEVCQNGHLCAAACGGPGQPCCSGSKCTTAGTLCNGTTCVACGAAGEPCCASDACTATGATCADSTTTAGAKVCMLPCLVTTGACASGVDLDCTTHCGPSRIGNATCSCSASAWTCGACTFPAGDYSCYKLPATVPACDPTTPPTAGAACTLAACTVCGAATGKAFIDASGATRPGYCVCATGHWSCAVPKQWPCPGNPGC